MNAPRTLTPTLRPARMARALRRLGKRVVGPRRRVVPVELIECTDGDLARRLGWARRPIAAYPFVAFFERALVDRAGAFSDLVTYYRTVAACLDGEPVEAHSRPDTFAAELAARHAAAGKRLTRFEALDPAVVDEAAAAWALRRLALLRSVTRHGLDARRPPGIHCRERGGRFILRDGHHRIAAAVALGAREIEVVVDAVLPSMAGTKRQASDGSEPTPAESGGVSGSGISTASETATTTGRVAAAS